MRIAKIIGWSTIALLIMLIAIVVLVVASLAIDPSVYRQPLQAHLSALLGRSVLLRGSMSVQIEWAPDLVIKDVSIANPAWASRADFARAERVEGRIALWPLLRGQLRILNMRLEGLDVLLEARPGGGNNWTFAGAAGVAATPPALKAYSCDNCVIAYRDAAGHEERLTIAAAAGVFAPTEPVQLLASGSYRDHPFTLSLLAGTPLDLVAGASPWPVQAKLRAAGATVKATGQLQREGATLDIELSGNELGELGTLVGASAYPLGPYKLSMQLALTKDRYRVSALNGFVGAEEWARRITLQTGSMLIAAGEPVEVRTEGKWGGESFALTMTGGTPEALRLPEKPWPIELNATAAGATLSAHGSVSDALTTANLDLAARLQGAQLGEFGALTGITLPALGPYALSARLNRRQGGYVISGITGFLGQRGSAQRVMLTGGDLRLPAGQALAANLKGSYAGVLLRLSLTGGVWSQIAAPQKPWPVSLTIDGPSATIAIRGSVARPLAGENFDVDMSASGGDLARLSPLLGATLPSTKSYRLTARVRDAGRTYVATDMRAQIDDTDLTGTLSLDRIGARPKLTAKLISKRFDVDKLMSPETSTIGAGSQDWLDRPLPMKRMRTVDLDLDVNVQQLAGTPTAVSNLALIARLEDRRATFGLAHMSLPGMTLAGSAVVDGHSKTPSFMVALWSKNVELQQVLKGFMHVSRLAVSGRSRLNFDLESRGHTPRELIEHANLRIVAESIEARFGDATANRSIPIKISAAKATATAGQPLSIVVEGVVRKLPVDLHVVTAPLLHVVDDRTNWPIDVELRTADNLFSVKGMIAKPFEAEGFDVGFDFHGRELSALGPLLGLKLPVLGRYELNGRFENGGGSHRVSGLELGVGKHHASGSLQLTTGPRPHIVAELHAGKIDIDQLADTLKALAPSALSEAGGSLVIPDLPIPQQWLRKVDFELDADIPGVISESTDIGDLTIKAKLDRGHLSFSSVRTQLFGGIVNADLDLDVAGDTPVVHVKLTARHLDYGRWLRAWKLTDQVRGTVDSSLLLDAHGRTLHALLGDANGASVLVSGPGRVAGQGFGLWGASVLSGLMSVTRVAAGLPESTKFNCMVWPFNVSDGIARSQAILVDTPSITINGRGTIDLLTRKIDFVLRPARKRASLFSFQNPIEITGTLDDPKRTTLGKGETVGKILLPFVNPAFLLLSVKLGTGEHNPCVAAIRGEQTKREKSKDAGDRLGLAGELLRAMNAPVDGTSGAPAPSSSGR